MDIFGEKTVEKLLNNAGELNDMLKTYLSQTK